MATSERLDFSQPNNELGQIAEQQRQKLIPKNDYKSVNPYSSTNKDAISDGDGTDAPFILNGGDYVKNWVNNTIGNLRKGDQQNTEIHRDYMPDDVNQDLIDDMGWLADMNRPSKEHSSTNDDIKITEALKRINDIMKKII